MKAKLAPVYYRDAHDPDFVKQVGHLHELLSQEAEILDPIAIGTPPPAEADAVVFPQMLGDAYRHLADFKAIQLPILVITSEFGTVSMWDWEINNYLAANGVKVLAPGNLASARQMCKACALKRELKETKFVVYQDNPGEGFQPDIFKRFYWWEKECIDSLQAKFGVTILKRSFRELAAQAKQISDADAATVWRQWQERLSATALGERPIRSALKIYLAVKHDIDQEQGVAAVGINCLNESRYSDTTPCLAWNILFEDQHIAWGCEADLVSMMTELLIQKTLGVPFMMTNLYPFLMGMAALKHERIPYFPAVPSEPENHMLLAHCGFFGLVPPSFSSEWKLSEKVLAIVDENAHVIDARLPEGDVTLVKLMPPFDALSVVQGKLAFYAQFENSDCRNGAVVRVPDGRRMVKELASHHYIITSGSNLADLEAMAQVFNLRCQVIG